MLPLLCTRDCLKRWQQQGRLWLILVIPLTCLCCTYLSTVNVCLMGQGFSKSEFCVWPCKATAAAKSALGCRGLCRLKCCWECCSPALLTSTWASSLQTGSLLNSGWIICGYTLAVKLRGWCAPWDGGLVLRPASAQPVSWAAASSVIWVGSSHPYTYYRDLQQTCASQNEARFYQRLGEFLLTTVRALWLPVLLAPDEFLTCRSPGCSPTWMGLMEESEKPLRKEKC